MTSLKDKIALVTGASRGIGKGIALILAKAGARVIGTATTEEGAQNIQKYFDEANLAGQGKVLNVTDASNIETLVDEIKSELGPIHILVNNAGIARDNLMLRMKEDEWQSVIDTNLTAIFRLTKACLSDMVKLRFGRIINISSVVGAMGNPGQANYVAAKAGLIGFTKSLACEVATRNITVNAVAPGYVETDMTNKLSEKHREMILSRIPMNRAGTADDIAYAVLFLASEKASYITGQTIHVNGGMYMV